MSYGFGDNDSAITLPKSIEKKATRPVNVIDVAEAGKKLGFVSREGQGRRKPGPKRAEPQSKLTLTGPERVLKRFQAYCDESGGVAYWQAIENLLDDAEQA